MAELILASTSPRRRELLTRLRRPFRVVPPAADETLPEGVSPKEAAEILAVRKARSVADRCSEGWVLGADTLVSADALVSGGEEIIGKPRDRGDAIAILRRLSRRPHRIITGVCLIDARSGRRWVDSETTTVTMRAMRLEEIEAYVDTGEAMGKAGAYAIQETGDRFVERVEGSMSNVVGLPIELVERLIEEMERAVEAQDNA